METESIDQPDGVRSHACKQSVLVCFSHIVPSDCIDW